VQINVFPGLSGCLLTEVSLLHLDLAVNLQAVGVFVESVLNLCVGLFCPPGAFFLYSSLALLGFVFIYGCLPETKARRLEEIEALFENQLCSCGASDSDEGRQVEYIRVKGSNYHLSDNDASDVE